MARGPRPAVEQLALEGWRSAQRDDVARLLADVRAGCVHVVVVNKVDRLVRDGRQFHNIIGEIEPAGALFVSATEGSTLQRRRAGRWPLDPARAASFERDRIVERTVGRHPQDGREGPPGRAAPPTYGMRAVVVEGVKHKALDVDEGESALLHLAARLVADDGCTPTEAADRVNGLGHRTRTGKPWTATSLRRVLSADGGACAAPSSSPGEAGPAQHGIGHRHARARRVQPRAQRRSQAAGRVVPAGERQGARRPVGPHVRDLRGEYRGPAAPTRGCASTRCMGHERKPRCGCANLNSEQVETAVWDAVRGCWPTPSACCRSSASTWNRGARR